MFMALLNQHPATLLKTLRGLCLLLDILQKMQTFSMVVCTVSRLIEKHKVLNDTLHYSLYI